MSTAGQIVLSPPAGSATLTVAPCTTVIGAEISGVDLREPLPAAVADELRSLLLRHRVLFFRDQHLDTAQHVAFARTFGRPMTFPTVLDSHPEHPEVHLVQPNRRSWQGGRRYRLAGWHVDASGLFAPPVANVLRAVDIPPVGGDTLWASGVAAFEGLPDEDKERLDGLYLTHDLTQHFAVRGIEYPLIAHRLVRTHPVTGEKLLYVNESMDSVVVGMNRAESAEIIDLVRHEFHRPQYQVRFRWSPGAIAVWDNRAVQHFAVRDYGDYPRYLERTLLADVADDQVVQYF